jgi:hypothetical protein
MQIHRYFFMHITYVCHMDATLKYDYVHSTPQWRKTGARYDCVVFNGLNCLEFASILALFTLHTLTIDLCVALICRYHSVGRHSSSDYIQLQDVNQIDFIFVDSIVRAVHILPPSTYNPFLTVQDISSPDIHLCLQ